MTLHHDAAVAIIERSSRKPLARIFVDLFRYGAASVAALAVDAGMLLLLASCFGVNYPAAAAVGFLSGLVVVYALSVRYVYSGNRGPAPCCGALGFLATGLIGLLLTQALMAFFVGIFGFPLGVAKAATIVVVFLFNFLSRRMLFVSNVVG
jgi:putative flippase GtrA